MFKMKKKRLVKAVGLMTAAALSVSILGACGQKAANDEDEQGRTILTVGLWPDREGTPLTDDRGQKNTL